MADGHHAQRLASSTPQLSRLQYAVLVGATSLHSRDRGLPALLAGLRALLDISPHLRVLLNHDDDGPLRRPIEVSTRSTALPVVPRPLLLLRLSRDPCQKLAPPAPRTRTLFSSAHD